MNKRFICGICTAVAYETLQDLNHHKNNCHRKSGEYMSNLSLEEKSMLLTSDIVEFRMKSEQRFFCDTCVATYTKWRHLERHQEKFHRYGLKWQNRKRKSQHQSKDVSVYVCPLCCDELKYRSDFSKHVKRHSEDSVRQSILTGGDYCEICEAGPYRNIEHALRHRKKAHGIKCKRRFLTKSRMFKVRRRYICGICTAVSFETKSELNEHGATHCIQSETNKRELNFICDICESAVFKDKVMLQKHKIKMHYNSINKHRRRYICNICAASFTHYTNLQHHRKMHGILIMRKGHCQKGRPPKDLKQFVCNMCKTASYKREDNLIRHKKKVHGVDINSSPDRSMLVCSFCNNMFETKRCLLQHLTIHYGEMYPDHCRLFLNCLPADMEYEIDAFKPCGTGFLAKFRFFINSVEHGKFWIHQFAIDNNVLFKLFNHKPRNTNVISKVDYRCNCGPNFSKSSTLRKRHKACPAHLLLTVIKRFKGNQTVLEAMVYLKYIHNHQVELSNFITPSEDVIEKYKQLFEAGHDPLTAYKIYQQQIKSVYGDSYSFMCADRSVCPTKHWVYNFYYKLLKSTGTTPKIDTKKIQMLLKNYNKKEHRRCAVFNKWKNGFVICIVTPFMKRVMELISSPTVFIDSSDYADRFGCKILLLMANSCIGGLPIGVIISSAKNKKLLTLGLRSFRNLFCKKCVTLKEKRDPHVFITDDTYAERTSLLTIFSQSVVLPCPVKILNRCWSYLWNPDTNIPVKDKNYLFSKVEKLLHLHDQYMLMSTYQAIIECSGVNKYNTFTRFIDKMYQCRKQEWNYYYLDGTYLPRIHKREYISEIASNVFKEPILQHCRASSPEELFQFIVCEFNDWYLQKVIDAANGQDVTPFSHKSSFLKFELGNLTSTQISNDVYSVRNCDTENNYMVEKNLHLCTCEKGSVGIYCEHQLLVEYNASDTLVHFDLTPEERELLHKVERNLTLYNNYSKQDEINEIVTFDVVLEEPNEEVTDHFERLEEIYEYKKDIVTDSSATMLVELDTIECQQIEVEDSIMTSLEEFDADFSEDPVSAQNKSDFLNRAHYTFSNIIERAGKNPLVMDGLLNMIEKFESINDNDDEGLVKVLQIFANSKNHEREFF